MRKVSQPDQESSNSFALAVLGGQAYPLWSWKYGLVSQGEVSSTNDVPHEIRHKKNLRRLKDEGPAIPQTRLAANHQTGEGPVRPHALLGISTRPPVLRKARFGSNGGKGGARGKTANGLANEEQHGKGQVKPYEEKK